LVEYVPASTPKYLIDPKAVNNSSFLKNIEIVPELAVEGVSKLVEKLLHQ